MRPEKKKLNSTVNIVIHPVLKSVRRRGHQVIIGDEFYESLRNMQENLNGLRECFWNHPRDGI